MYTLSKLKYISYTELHAYPSVSNTCQFQKFTFPLLGLTFKYSITPLQDQDTIIKHRLIYYKQHKCSGRSTYTTRSNSGIRYHHCPNIQGAITSTVVYTTIVAAIQVSDSSIQVSGNWNLTKTKTHQCSNQQHSSIRQSQHQVDHSIRQSYLENSTKTELK